MQQHNITQAQVMEGEDNAQRLERGGMSIVKIEPRTQYVQMDFEPWVPNLNSAICRFFDCQAFRTRFPRLDRMDILRRCRKHRIWSNGFRDDVQLDSKLGLAS